MKKLISLLLTPFIFAGVALGQTVAHDTLGVQFEYGASAGAVAPTSGDFKAADDLISTDDVTVGDDLVVSGLATIGETLVVTGQVSTVGASDVTAGDDLISTDDVTVGDDLNVTGLATVGETMNVVGDFSIATNKFNVAAASGNTTVAGTLIPTGKLTASAGIVGKIATTDVHDTVPTLAEMTTACPSMVAGEFCFVNDNNANAIGYLVFSTDGTTRFFITSVKGA